MLHEKTFHNNYFLLLNLNIYRIFLKFVYYIVSQKYSNQGKLAFYTSTLLGFACNIITYFIMKILRKFVNYSIAFECMQKEIRVEGAYFTLS